jgi:class 3 adenylate cyclase/tetratricopeptide (TPR) repeat protein
MQCAKCGTSNPSKAKFCEECGARLTRTCPGCDTPAPADKKFCGECGTSLVAPPLPPVASSQLQVLRCQTLASDPQLPLSYTPSHLANRILSGKAALEGERKIVTVLFADIKGSMDIMERLDPEEAKQLIDPCLQQMMKAVHRVEGTVNRILGDGIMALFGAPLALEDHAQRALYAALLMHDAVDRYAVALREQHGISLQIRVGVNTGEVVVRTISNNLYMDYSAVGHAVGLAARMESLAPPGSTLVTLYTHRITRDFFRFAARGGVKVKGVRDPLETYELLGPGTSHSRLAARATQGLSPFVGRTRELAQLQETLTLVGPGRGQVVTLIGEAGVGKSRLLEELKPTLRTQGYLLIEGTAFPYGKTRAYLPLIEMLKHYCNLSDQDSPETYRTRLQEKLAMLDTSLVEYVPVLLELFGIDSNDPYTASLPAEARLQRILDAIKRLIAAQSRRQPVALIIEDLHWLDARSLAFLHPLITSLAVLPAVLLCTHRPGTTYPWEEQSFVHRLQITPLPRDLISSLFTALVGTDPTVAPLAALAGERSGGNPFFLEEIVQNLVENGTLRGRPGAYELTRPVAEWTSPPTVHGVLASRLDRLPPSLKIVLQTAAVIGREVPRPLLARVAGLTDTALDQALALLQAREFLYETAVYPEPVYTFKHALTQEVAYQELLHERRTALHATVAAAIEGLYGDTLAEHVTLLAYHYSRSPDTAKALHYLNLAGQRAFDLYADTDALQLWEERLRLLATLPRHPERDRQEVRTRSRVIGVLSRQGNEEVLIRAQFDAAEAVCQRLNDARLLAELHATLALAHVLWGRPRRGLPHASAARQLADSLQNAHLQVISHGPLAHLLWFAGRFSEGLQAAEEGIAIADRQGFFQEHTGAVRYPALECKAIAGVCRGFLGDFDQGFNALQEAARMTAKQSNRIPQGLTHWALSLLLDLRGETLSGLREADHAFAVMQDIGSPPGMLLVGSVREHFTFASSGPALYPISPPTSYLEQTWERQLSFCELAGAWLAEARFHTGHQEEALQLARTVVARANTSESIWFLCAAHLTLGRLLARTTPNVSVPAQDHLLTALHHAETMQSRPLCVHALLALGESWNRGQRTAAEAAKARDYFIRAADLCGTLGMYAYQGQALSLLTKLDKKPPKKRKPRS